MPYTPPTSRFQNTGKRSLSVHVEASVQSTAQTRNGPTWESAGCSPQHWVKGLRCPQCEGLGAGTPGDP